MWSVAQLDSALVQRVAWATPEFIEAQIVGYFPQVDRTYAIVEAQYGVMNEVGVAMGESTCASVFYGKPARACPSCGGPLVDITILSVVALERCATARCAVETMGALAQTLGYYAADTSYDEGGEALTVIDASEVGYTVASSR